MDLFAPNLSEKIGIILEQFKNLRFREAMCKLKKAQMFLREHPVVGVIVTPILFMALLPSIFAAVIILGPFLFILGSAMAFIGGVLVLSSPFLLGVFAPMVISAAMVIASLYTTYYITSAVLCHFRRLAERLTSFFSRFGKSDTRAEQQLVPTSAKEVRSSDELEEIEPDYRDRQDKLYDALVRKEYKEGDTFEPFNY